MHADDLTSAVRDATRNLCNTDGARVGCQDSVLWCNRCDVLEDALFEFKVFRGGLDDKICAAEVLDCVAVVNTAHH